MRLSLRSAARAVSARVRAPSSIRARGRLPFACNASEMTTIANNTKKVEITPAVSKEAGKGLLDFVNSSWTQFHAVEETSKRLMAAGFQHIAEKDAWDLAPGGKYFFTRNMSTIVAFAVGKKYEPGNGFYMVGAHTDSPVLKLKPVSKSTKSGCLMVNIEPYGGGLWHTWFDRDLTVAGRVLVKAADGKLLHRLVKINKPILRIPMLAIHLQRTLSTDGFKPNTQKELLPLLATTIKAQVDVKAEGKEKETKDEQKHHTVLMEVLASELGCTPADILDIELNVLDLQPGCIGGIQDEFIFAARLDNLCMCYCALQAFLQSLEAEGALEEEAHVRAVAFFDHEEVGSSSAQGAGGPIMRDTIKRVSSAMAGGQEGAVERALLQSFLVSADMAHALHPNYSDKHDPEHAPKFHKGLVVKYNHQQRYATNAVGAALFREVGKGRGLPCQEFSVRNDMPCGSTIGPILSSLLGCRTVDIGAPMLSMHSIREMCGCDDVAIAVAHLRAFFEDFAALDASLDVDSLPPPQLLGTLEDVPCDHVH